MNLKTTAFVVLGLTALTITLPLLDILSKGATFFVAHGANPADIALFVGGSYLAPPLLILGTILLAGLFSARLANLLMMISLGVLAGLWAMGNAPELSTALTFTLGALLGALVAWAVAKQANVRSMLQLIGQASPLILVYVLGFTPINGLVFPESSTINTSATQSRIPVVMLVLDELSLAGIIAPDGKIDAGRLPNFERLRKLSTWYYDTTTVSANTHKAIPAILSGQIPRGDALPVHQEYPQNFFTLLAPSHDIQSIESVSRMCPEGSCNHELQDQQSKFSAPAMYRDAIFVWLHWVAPAELAQKYLPSIAQGWRDFTATETDADKTDKERWYGLLLDKLITDATGLDVSGVGSYHTDRFDKFLLSIRNSSGASANYLHTFLPHHPWVHLPDGRVYNGASPPGKSADSVWSDNQFLVDQGVLQYALQVEYVDGMLGQLLDTLQASGRLEESLLIVVADHGLAISPGVALRVPEAATLADITRVPLFIKYPGQAAARLDLRRAQTIDIVPTLAEVLGIKLTEPVAGRSLLAEHPPTIRRIMVEAPETIEDMESAMNMARANERIYRVVTPGRSALESFALGRSGNIIDGLAGADIPLSTSLLLRLDNPGKYADLDIDAMPLPLRLTGSLNNARPGTEILITLNGKFAGSGESYDLDGSVSVLLDPRQLRRGSNQVKAYTVTNNELRELPLQSVDQ